MDNKIEEVLRQSFMDETGKHLWASPDDEDYGFVQEYVFWLEKKFIQRTSVLESLIEVYNEKGQLLSFNINLVREVLK